ncbi:MAG: hypothetical protein ACLUB2_03445 [Butyricicoccus pullicaecorum]
MGSVEPEIKLAADPTIILHPASEAQMDQVMEDLGIPVDGKYLGFGLRSWNVWKQLRTRSSRRQSTHTRPMDSFRFLYPLSSRAT